MAAGGGDLGTTADDAAQQVADALGLGSAGGADSDHQVIDTSKTQLAEDKQIEDETETAGKAGGGAVFFGIFAAALMIVAPGTWPLIALIVAVVLVYIAVTNIVQAVYHSILRWTNDDPNDPKTSGGRFYSLVKKVAKWALFFAVLALIIFLVARRGRGRPVGARNR